MIADNCTRDINTSQALIAGLGNADETSFSINGSIFNPATTGVCPPPSEQFMDAALQARWNELPVPSNHSGLLEYMQSLMGEGVAPAIQNIVDSVFDSGFNGGSQLGGNFAEFFEMQARALGVYTYLLTHLANAVWWRPSDWLGQH